MSMMNFRNGGVDEESVDPWAAFLHPNRPHPARPPEVVAAHDPIYVQSVVRMFPRHIVVKMIHLANPHRATHQSALNEFVARIAARWSLSADDIARLLGVEGAEVASDVIRGYLPLRGRDSEDRVANLFRIYEALFGLFQDADAEREWIRHPAEAFGGKSCLERMLQGGIEDLVDVRRAVEHIVGR
jgi:hypothetical protein